MYNFLRGQGKKTRISDNEECFDQELVNKDLDSLFSNSKKVSFLNGTDKVNILENLKGITLSKIEVCKDIYDPKDYEHDSDSDCEEEEEVNYENSCKIKYCFNSIANSSIPGNKWSEKKKESAKKALKLALQNYFPNKTISGEVGFNEKELWYTYTVDDFQDTLIKKQLAKALDQFLVDYDQNKHSNKILEADMYFEGKCLFLPKISINFKKEKIVDKDGSVIYIDKKESVGNALKCISGFKINHDKENYLENLYVISAFKEGIKKYFGNNQVVNKTIKYTNDKENKFKFESMILNLQEKIKEIKNKYKTKTLNPSNLYGFFCIHSNKGLKSKSVSGGRKL